MSYPSCRRVFSALEKEGLMEVDWVCKRAHLRAVLQLHPDWSQQQLADAVGCSKSMVSQWKKRFAQADPHPPRVAQEVVERLIAHAPRSSRKLAAYARPKGVALLLAPR